MIFNMSETNIGGVGDLVDITDQIVPTECTPLEGFKAYLINNNLVMFGSLEVSPYYSDLPLITIPQSFNYVVGGQQNSSSGTSYENSGGDMPFTTLEDSTEIYINLDTIDFEYPIYISIFATNMEE